MKTSTLCQPPIADATPSTQGKLGYYLTTAALFAAFILSIVSWLRLCSQACLESHNYRLYGFTFEEVGLLFFPVLLVTHLFSRRFAVLHHLLGLMLCGALGAELMFIYLQKYVIGAWCPLCLSIAAALAVAGFTYFYVYISNFKMLLQQRDRGIMSHIFKGFTGTFALAAGFIIAFGGISKPDELRAEQETVKQQMAFGNLNSAIEVYVFTDWECPACRSLEPMLEKMAPAVMQKARLTFVDDPVHAATLNFTPYNLSFMINNKANYFSLRQGLTELARQTKTPKDAQIEALAKARGQKFTELNYGDVSVGSKYFDHLIRHYDVEGTPTVVVANKTNKKSKKLEGSTEITQTNVLKAIADLSISSGAH